MANSEQENSPLVIHHIAIEPGEKRYIEIPIAGLPTQTTLNMPLSVIRGAKPGPSLWMNAALHGDELNGTEIITQVLEKIHANHLRGTIIAVPIVNIFGFITQSRYLPDRKDLNRCFPGSKQGSLGSSIAHVLMENVVAHCDYGLDFHTGSLQRGNTPQIRGNFENKKILELARAFGAPFLLNSDEIKGSLREAAIKKGKIMVIYEGGEERRYNKDAIECGVTGTWRVLEKLGMYDCRLPKLKHEPIQLSGSTWIRARRSGLVRWKTDLGKKIHRGQIVAYITDAFGESSMAVESPSDGYALGLAMCPLVHKGDGILHLGQL